MLEKLKEIRKNRLIEVETCGGLGPNPGISNIIVTKDKKIYFYQKYFRLSEYYKEKYNLKEESLSNEIVLTINQYEKIIEFIEQRFANKQFKPNVIMDYSSTIYIDYPNCQNIIHNNLENLEHQFRQLLVLINVIKNN